MFKGLAGELQIGEPVNWESGEMVKWRIKEVLIF
jgi:hypothetical protein